MIDRLVAKGVLHDGRVAMQLAEHAWHKKGWSRTLVREVLAERGAPEHAIEAALSALPDESEGARAILRERLAAGQPLPRIVRRLLSKGFDPACVSEALTAEGLGEGFDA